MVVSFTFHHWLIGIWTPYFNLVCISVPKISHRERLITHEHLDQPWKKPHGSNPSQRESHRTSTGRNRLYPLHWHCVLKCIGALLFREIIHQGEQTWSDPTSTSSSDGPICVHSLSPSSWHEYSHISTSALPFSNPILAFPRVPPPPLPPSCQQLDREPDAPQSWSGSPRRSNCVQIARLCANLRLFPVAAAATGGHLGSTAGLDLLWGGTNH